ncbi:hypothetical protein PFBG_05432 [Plasmodium falciparum 7G8]|uniref:Uncharacterized protein n=1 Tax=Plasmodium falciparum (isolate 7G8) TaxID=57266 RepID=W7F111_PLAF8|nr:hypothetical protein PFBG_05432 [Plasmodium falciparum 7G8]
MTRYKKLLLCANRDNIFIVFIFPNILCTHFTFLFFTLTYLFVNIFLINIFNIKFIPVNIDSLNQKKKKEKRIKKNAHFIINFEENKKLNKKYFCVQNE